jgi:cell division protein FtsW
MVAGRSLKAGCALPWVATQGHLPLHGYLLLALVVALTLVGLLALSSAGRAFSSDPTHIVSRQAVWLLPALLGMAAAYWVHPARLRALCPWLTLLAVGLLVLVLIPGIGVSVNGARRWLDIGFARLQPSDFAKPALVLLMAHYLALTQRKRETFSKGFFVPMSLLGLFCVLIILEPDFGTTALFGAVGITLMFVSGIRLLYLIPTVMAAGTLFGTLVYLDPVRLQRITSFMDVEGNKQDTAYQLWQGLVAFGVGGRSGVGLGQGRQQLNFLPEAHTDFIYPIIAEELGLVATMGIAVAFLLMFLVVVLNLRKAPDLYQCLLALGCICFITYQALINIGVVTGLLPTKGMSLPFISYGGSNLLVMYILIGLILNGFREWEAPVLPHPSEL